MNLKYIVHEDQHPRFFFVGQDGRIDSVYQLEGGLIGRRAADLIEWYQNKGIRVERYNPTPMTGEAKTQELKRLDYEKKQLDRRPKEDAPTENTYECVSTNS